MKEKELTIGESIAASMLATFKYTYFGTKAFFVSTIKQQFPYLANRCELIEKDKHHDGLTLHFADTDITLAIEWVDSVNQSLGGLVLNDITFVI